MTDDQMDVRLRAAGERWRTEHTTVATVAPPVPDETTPDVAATAHSPKRRWSLLASAAAVAAALVVGGTFLLHDSHSGPTPTGDTAALEGHVWQVDGSAPKATLYIGRDGNLVADDECRVVGGTATVDGSTLTVTDQIVRFKSCTDQYGPGLYDQGTTILNGASTFSITTDALTISKDGKELKFGLAPDTTPPPTLDIPTFVGADWTLVSAKDARGAAVAVAGDPTLHVGDDLKLSGTDGCNSLQGSLTLEGNQLTFGDVGGTEVYCPGDAGATEKAILDFMQGTARETVVGTELTLTKDKAELVYRWTPKPSDANDPDAFRSTQWVLLYGAGTALPPDTNLCADPSCSSFDVAQGTAQLRNQHSAFAAAIGLSAHVWIIRDGHLYLYLDDTQADALVFGRAATPPPAQGSPLIGTTWHVLTIKAGTGTYRNGAPPAEDETITFTDSGFTAKHMCFTQEGDRRTLSKTSFAISGARSVDALPCPFIAGRDASATASDSVLAGEVSWSVDGGTLTLTNTIGTLVLTDAVDQATAAPLDGTDWRLETAVDQNSEELPADGQQFRIQNGQVSASDGVNTISGPVTSDGGLLTFGALATTDIGSTTQDPVHDVIDTVLQSGDVSYQIRGDALTLSKGVEQLIYRVHKDSGTDSIFGAWNLTTIEHGTGPDGIAQSASIVGPLVFSSISDGASFTDCDAARAVVSQSSIAFGGWADNLLSCPSLGPADSNFVFGQVLTGTCTYAIDGDQLTITKAGVGAIVLTHS